MHSMPLTDLKATESQFLTNIASMTGKEGNRKVLRRNHINFGQSS